MIGKYGFIGSLQLLLLFLLLPLLFSPAAAESTNNSNAPSPFRWLACSTDIDGTATLNALALTETAVKDSNGTLYLPSEDEGRTITRIYTGLFQSDELQQFTRVVIPATVTEFVTGAPYHADGLVIKGRLKELIFAEGNPVFTVAENGSILQGSKLAGIPYDKEKTDFAIPDGVETADLALIAEAYPKLTGLTLPASLTDLYCTESQYPTTLQQIHVQPGNPVYRAEEGVLFRDQTLCLYPSANPAEQYTVPEGTTSISGNAFHVCRNLKQITLPETMEWLQTDAFHACRNMHTVNLPAGLARIDEGAFSYCWELENLLLAPENTACTLADNLLIHKETGTLLAAVGNGESLITLPETIRAVGARAFTNHADMTHVALNEGLEAIGAEAFNFTSLEEIRLPCSLATIGMGAFSGCEELTAVTFADGSSMLSSIEAAAFSYSTLETILFPENCALKTIGNDAFYSCNSLEQITLPNGLEELGDWVFSECARLKKIHLPDSIHKLGMCCFDSCPALYWLTLPQGLTELDPNILGGTSYIKFLVLPDHIRLPSFIPDSLKKLNAYGCGRLVVQSGSKAQEECVRMQLPYTLSDTLPFYLGTLRATGSDDAQLQQFLDRGGSLRFLYKGGRMIITAETAEGIKSELRLPCTIEDGKILLPQHGNLDYTTTGPGHVELIAGPWRIQLEGEELP